MLFINTLYLWERVEFRFESHARKSEIRVRVYYIYANIKAMNRIYKKKSLTNAKELRQNQTDCEQIIWYNLRNRRLNNIKFRRQVPIGQYIVDFAALDKKLIVELDGSQHIEDTLEYDKNRTDYLVSQGYKVIRFLDNEIIENLDGVLNKILEIYEGM